MIKVILLIAAIFKNPNFTFCFGHIFNFVKKLRLKTMKLKIKVVNKQIGQI